MNQQRSGRSSKKGFGLQANVHLKSAIPEIDVVNRDETSGWSYQFIVCMQGLVVSFPCFQVRNLLLLSLSGH